MHRILIVDDDPDFCTIACDYLTHAGYEVTGVRSAREANHALATFSPDLAIVDGFLSDRDGETWIAGLRRAGNRALKIIFISSFAAYAHDYVTQQRMVHDLGVSHVLAKPIDMTVLRVHIDKLLSQDPNVVTLARLGELRRTYGTALPTKVATIATSVEQARTTRALRPLEEARRLAHTLEGTAGSYGFLAVGEAAGRMFELLERNTPPWDQVDSSMDDLRRHVAKAQAEV